jgi:hypothetical protein
LKAPETEVFTVAGLQVPLTGVAFDELDGKMGAVAFRHTLAGILAKFTVINGLTVIVKLAVVAHCPALGVKV